MVYFVRLVKSGNSYVIALPAPVRDALHLGRNDQLALTVDDGRIVMAKWDDHKQARFAVDHMGAKP